MASITRARADLLNGGLVKLRDEVSLNKDGILTYTADFCCLSSFSSQHGSTFLSGSTPPQASEQLAAAKARAMPTLTDVSTRTESGLVYISATYITQAAPANQEASESPAISGLDLSSLGPESSALVTTEERTFSGKILQNNVLVDFRFDYLSTSVSVENINGGQPPEFNIPNATSLVSSPFNIYLENTSTAAAARLAIRRASEADVIVSTRATYSSSGKYSVAVTQTGVYVAAGALNESDT